VALADAKPDLLASVYAVAMASSTKVDDAAAREGLGKQILGDGKSKEPELFGRDKVLADQKKRSAA
jgi:hypothetical protein